MRQDEGFYIEYDEILCHNRVEFYGTYVGRYSTQEEMRDYLLYIFEDFLGWSPEELRDHFTHELAEKLHITRLISKIKWPVELDRDKDLFYVAVFLYPDRITYPRRERVLAHYREVYLKKEKTSQKTFFDPDLPEMYLLNCMEYIMEEEFGDWSPEDIYAFFSGKKKTYMDVLRKYKIGIACQLNYEYIIDIVHQALPEEKRDTDLYAFWRVIHFYRDNKLRKKTDRKEGYHD